jgi:hypothetical protein
MQNAQYVGKPLPGGRGLEELEAPWGGLQSAEGFSPTGDFRMSFSRVVSDRSIITGILDALT